MWKPIVIVYCSIFLLKEISWSNNIGKSEFNKVKQEFSFIWWVWVSSYCRAPQSFKMQMCTVKLRVSWGVFIWSISQIYLLTEVFPLQFFFLFIYLFGGGWREKEERKTWVEGAAKRLRTLVLKWPVMPLTSNIRTKTN